MEEIIIIGAGAAGLSAALALAENGVKSVLVAEMPSERTQSVMAEGGINAANLSDVDSPALHAEETLRAGRYLADPVAVRNLTENAPQIIEELWTHGMSFTLNNEGRPDVRAFGGQSVKRTYYAADSIGMQLMNTLIGQVRRYEAEDIVHRMTGWLFSRLLWEEDQVCGCVLIHAHTGESVILCGKVIIASGGLNGMFGNATGSARNFGNVTASLFSDGVAIANGEFIQYHPTTVPLHGKNMLITEAVRGEGGRLFTMNNGRPYYFMEEKYPDHGNLMPRDVIVREEWALMQKGQKIYLDMSCLDKTIQQEKLGGVVENCRRFLFLDPTEEPIPIVPGIHYFMGGIRVDRQHRTGYRGLYAAGECACQYHGANRLGGNSLLGAVYGGRTAAKSAMMDDFHGSHISELQSRKQLSEAAEGSYVDGILSLRCILQKGLGIVRDAETMRSALSELSDLCEKINGGYDPSASVYENELLQNCCMLGKALLLGANERKESRGAHTRSDFPAERHEYQRQTVAKQIDGQIRISFETVEGEDAH